MTEPLPGWEAVPVDITPDALYWFRGIRGPKDDKGRETWAFKPGLYRCVGVALDYRTRQEKVVYLGLNKWDARLHLAGLSDWERDFYQIDTEAWEKQKAEEEKQSQPHSTVPKAPPQPGA